MGKRYIRENFVDIYTRRDNSSVTQNCISMNLSDPLPVLETYKYVNKTNTIPMYALIDVSAAIGKLNVFHCST